MTPTERLWAVLRLFLVEGEALDLDARTRDGFGEKTFTVPWAADGLPLALLRDLTERWTFRLHPAARAADGTVRVVPALVVLFRPSTDFHERRHIVTAAGQTAIAAALALMPRPSLVVDAGPEVWASWALDRPLADLGQAQTLLRRLAAHLGGDAEAVQDLRALTLPIAGPIRSWNTADPETIVIEHVDPTLRYTRAELEEMISTHGQDETALQGASPAAITGRGQRAPRPSAA